MTDDPLSLYKKMVQIRIVESKLQEYCLKGLAGDLHFNKGQEAISVGVCSALRSTDYIVTHHRTIAHTLAKGASLHPLLAELLGKATGVNKGIAGEMHINYPAVRHMFSFQLVGTCVPVSVGLAYALKYYRKTDDIVCVFFGDAATSNAQAHEGLNIASIKKVPLLLVCENNRLAGNITSEYYLPTRTVAERMAAYSIPSTTIDGRLVMNISEKVKQIIDTHVRPLQQPYLIEMYVDRLSWHKQGQRDIRSQEEIARLAKRDPILQQELMLQISDQQRQEIWRGIESEIDEALKQVDADPYAFMENATEGHKS
mgnify:CR=1 FL=1